MIPHPNPIVVTPAFNGAWITSVRIIIGSSGFISYARYNGIHTLGERHAIITIQPHELALLEPIIIAEAKRLFSIVQLKYLSVQATFPDQPIKIVFVEHNDMSYKITDARSYATTDVDFVAAFDSVMMQFRKIINK